MKKILVCLIIVILLSQTLVFADVNSVTAELVLQTAGQSDVIEQKLISGSVKVSGTSDTNASVIVAAYNKGSLVQAKTIYKGPLNTPLTEMSFTLNNIKCADTVKAFVWDSSTASAPLCKAAEVKLSPTQVIIFKFDDVRPEIYDQTMKVDKAVDYLTSQGIRGTAGILGRWLVNAVNRPQDYEEQINAIKGWIDDNHQLWIHGYDHAEGEFGPDPYGNGTPAKTYKEQKEIIATTYDLIYDCLGYDTTCFAASFNLNNNNTIKALNNDFPQITSVMFASDETNSLRAFNIPIENCCTIESGTGIASFDSFTEAFKSVDGKSCAVLQGHPGYWDDNSFEEFKKIVAYVKSRDFVFMTPDEYRLFITE